MILQRHINTGFLEVVCRGKRRFYTNRELKLGVPEGYFEPIKEHAKKKGMRINQLVISLLEKDMGIEIVTIRERNKHDDEE